MQKFPDTHSGSTEVDECLLKESVCVMFLYPSGDINLNAHKPMGTRHRGDKNGCLQGLRLLFEG